jgi:hypothetical protein
VTVVTQNAHSWETRTMGNGRRIPLKGYRIDKRGQLVRDLRKLDVSARLRQRASRRVRLVRRPPR